MQNVPASPFLSNAKPVLKKLIALLQRHFTYVSVLGTDVSGKNYRVSDRVTSISDTTWGERGFVIRVFEGGRYYEYAFNLLPDSDTALEKLCETITNNARDAMQGEGFTYPAPVEEEITQTFHGKVETLPTDVSPEEIIAKLTQINKKMHETSELLVEAIATVAYAQTGKIFLSAKKELEQHYIWSEAYIIPVARRGEVTQNAYKSYAGLKGFELLEEVEVGITETVQTVVKMLDAKPVPAGEYDVICSPDAVGIIAHEAFGHGVELDMFLKNRANAKEYMDKPVASPMVKMHDGATATNHMSSYLFDDEGNLGSDTVIIEGGILKAGISDALAAAHLGSAPTGNGKRQKYDHKAYSRMTNTFFAAGNDTVEDMIASISHGYMIMDASSGMEDPKDWGIQCMFSYAIEIKDGKLTDNWVSPVVMTGYVPELLKNITMMGKEVEFSGGGGCGKGHKEWVKVSCGGPYIKTKARLG
ncbi:MAG: TldD/PmbA family protein [Defluviitaleaceae bacterium]|nr:TldD/PmbA family protein [Defluviitaleaceae bacterium]MCL2275459.1 TldD/PmbA family protein [Defluviitaleaceae bacterium]